MPGINESDLPSVASDGNSRAAGAQQAECTRQSMGIPNTAGTRDAERSSFADRSIRHDWTPRRSRRAVRAAVQRTAASRARRCTARIMIRERGAGVHAAVDQDRRLPRGLRVLPAGGALPHRRAGAEIDERGGSAGTRAGGEAMPAPAVSAWARRGVARRIATCPKVAEIIRAVNGLGHGNLRDAGHAQRIAGAMR